MAVITAQIIIDKAEIILQDTTNVRWPETELLGWLNDGQREVVLQKPDAYTKNEAVVLIEGTKQSVPLTGIQLIDVIRNMGADGMTPGNAITLLSRNILDTQNPAWHADPSDAVVKHYMFDDRDPRDFYVYPPQPATACGYIEIVYSAAPADILITATISLDDVYANCLLDYILYRAYSKDKDFANNNQRALAHYTAFMNSLGIREKGEIRDDPNLRAKLPIGGSVGA